MRTLHFVFKYHSYPITNITDYLSLNPFDLVSYTRIIYSYNHGEVTSKNFRKNGKTT
jgi:hypothetical protein